MRKRVARRALMAASPLCCAALSPSVYAFLTADEDERGDSSIILEAACNVFGANSNGSDRKAGGELICQPTTQSLSSYSWNMDELRASGVYETVPVIAGAPLSAPEETTIVRLFTTPRPRKRYKAPTTPGDSRSLSVEKVHDSGWERRSASPNEVEQQQHQGCLEGQPGSYTRRKAAGNNSRAKVCRVESLDSIYSCTNRNFGQLGAEQNLGNMSRKRSSSLSLLLVSTATGTSTRSSEQLPRSASGGSLQSDSPAGSLSGSRSSSLLSLSSYTELTGQGETRRMAQIRRSNNQEVFGDEDDDGDDAGGSITCGDGMSGSRSSCIYSAGMGSGTLSPLPSAEFEAFEQCLDLGEAKLKEWNTRVWKDALDTWRSKLVDSNFRNALSLHSLEQRQAAISQELQRCSITTRLRIPGGVPRSLSHSEMRRIIIWCDNSLELLETATRELGMREPKKRVGITEILQTESSFTQDVRTALFAADVLNYMDKGVQERSAVLLPETHQHVMRNHLGKLLMAYDGLDKLHRLPPRPQPTAAADDDTTSMQQTEGQDDKAADMQAESIKNELIRKVGALCVAMHTPEELRHKSNKRDYETVAEALELLARLRAQVKREKSLRTKFNAVVRRRSSVSTKPQVPAHTTTHLAHVVGQAPHSSERPPIAASWVVFFLDAFYYCREELRLLLEGYPSNATDQQALHAKLNKEQQEKFGTNGNAGKIIEAIMGDVHAALHSAHRCFILDDVKQPITAATAKQCMSFFKKVQERLQLLATLTAGGEQYTSAAIDCWTKLLTTALDVANSKLHRHAVAMKNTSTNS